MSEQGRIAVSGPEVIETNRGVEEFDSRDRALVWRTMGGKHRRLLGGAEAFVDDTVQDFRDAALELLGSVAGFGIDTLKAEQARARRAAAAFRRLPDAVDIWSAEGIPDAELDPRIARRSVHRPRRQSLEDSAMTLDDILASLFPDGHDVKNDGGVLFGSGTLRSGGQALVIGVANRTALGVDEAILLSGHVLSSIEKGSGPILVIVDSDSQRMSKRDELLGLNEFLAHLAKCLIYADIHGRPTIGLLYGHSAAGAFLATALATRVLVGLPGADPVVMDLPSMAKVTKLSIEVLQEKAKSTPVFAPGLSQSRPDRSGPHDLGRSHPSGRPA